MVVGVDINIPDNTRRDVARKLPQTAIHTRFEASRMAVWGNLLAISLSLFVTRYDITYILFNYNESHWAVVTNLS